MGENRDRSSSPDDAPSVATLSSRRSVHGCLGGGAADSVPYSSYSVADVLLWKRPTVSFSVLLCVSIVWFLFERVGYSFLSLVANIILSLVAILFFWAKSAALLNRPLPPLPNLEVSEDSIEKISCATRIWINRVLAINHDIAVERNLKRFLEVIIGLWLVSFIGSLFTFLTLVYTRVVLALTVPGLYDKYQDPVDKKLCAGHRFLLPYLTKIDNVVLSKIPISTIKQKKME